ncbi:MAG: hypothetical protein A2137_03435, partial [Chloroflexi bacterium RBG_16_58_8]
AAPRDREIAAGPDLERYRRPTRFLHWVNAVAFGLLLLTGLAAYLSPQSTPGPSPWLRYLHQAAGVIFVIAPLGYAASNWPATRRGIREAFTWGENDIKWLIAVPRYFYSRDEDVLPPQDHLNAAQKIWWFLVIVLGPELAVSGFIMWAAPARANPLYQWSAVFHDIAFILIASMFLLHIYLSVVNPLGNAVKNESWSAMTGGRVSAGYARTHHHRWFREITRSRKEPAS